MTSWTLIITAIGSIGWLLLLREGLQRWSQKGLSRANANQEFNVRYAAQSLGRLKLITLEWQDYTYCIAVDMHGSYIQVIDKHPINRSST